MSDDPKTRPTALSDSEIERIVRAMSKTGANVNIQDPRVSQVQNWILATIGLGIVSAGVWVGRSLNDLKVIAGQQSVLIEQMDRRVTKLEERKP